MRPTLLAAAVVGIVSVIATALPASATEQCPASTLVITAYSGEDTSGPVDATVTLECQPAGGNHAEAEEACASLDAVGGDLDALPGRDTLCLYVYQPVTVKVVGSWRGKAVNFVHTYSNQCDAYGASDGVFDFNPAAP
jgi:hypothetical protein